MTMTPQNILHFWYHELKPKDWWVKNPDLDRYIAKRFGPLLKRAAQAELADWRDTPRGRLAEVIVLDQFSRNVYRDQPDSFSQDPLALALSQEAHRGGHDQSLSLNEKSFLYMPYMHSESLKVHEEAIKVFDLPGLEKTLEFEIKHKKIIERFGRYPHRNKILGRKSTSEEREFLTQPGSSF
ncbi:MAG: DUF924 family protein [Pseudomonadota bacterium]